MQDWSSKSAGAPIALMLALALAAMLLVNVSVASSVPLHPSVHISVQQNPIPFGYNDTLTATQVSMPPGTTLSLYVNGNLELSDLSSISCDLSGSFNGEQACYFNNIKPVPVPAGQDTFTVNAISSSGVVASSSLSVSVTPPITEPYCIVSGTYKSLGGCLESAIPLSVIGLLLTFIVIALAYMLGEVVKIDSLKKWYKGELWEAAKTMMLIIVIFSVLIIMSGIAINFISGSSSPNFQIGVPGAGNRIAANLQALYSSAETYTVTQLNVAENAYNTALGLADGIQLLKSLNLKVWFPVPLVPPLPFFGSLQFGFSGSIYNTNVLESFSPTAYSFLKAFISMILVPIVIILEFQSEFLYTGAVIGVGIFIPIGIVLRAFPFIRGIGGNMLAVGIALAIIYPSVLVLLNLPISSIVGYSLTTTTPSCSGFVCDLNYVANALTSFFSSSMATGFSAGFASFGSIYPAMNIITSKEFIDVLLQFILFIFDLVIVVVITQSIAKALGGELNLSFGKFNIA